MLSENYSVLDDHPNRKEFFDNILPLIKLFNNYKISRNIEDKINTSILKTLKISALSQLRDKYEGVAYQDKTHRRIGAYIILQHVFTGCRLSDIDIQNPNIDFSLITYKNIQYGIIVFKFGQIPKLDFSINKNHIILMQRDNNNFYICGVHVYTPNNTKKTKTNFLELTDFSKLININEIL